MRFHEIARRSAAPDTHPFTADITVNPATVDDFERAMENRPEVILLCRIDQPDAWVVHVACTTERIRAEVGGAWG